jgi:small subunit ribosomal protein S5
MPYQYERPEKEFEETVVAINRISKKTKGGNQIRFSALVVVGDRKGRVGVGLSKARDVRGAIQKAIAYAKRRMINAPLKDTTIPFAIKQKYNAAYILLKPAPAGTGIIAGGPMRVVLEGAGIKDVVGKILGTKNKISNVYATMEALKALSKIEERRGAK